MNQNIIALMIASLLVLISGCVSEALVRDPEYAVVRPAAIKAQEYSNGAIYKAGYDFRLYEDQRARRVGDILTIILTEQTDASKSATTSLEKDTTTSITNPTILGSSPKFDIPGVNDGNNFGTSLGSAHDFEGEGKSAQSNSLSGNLSVTVVEVLPNGNLVIRGEKIISLNQGDEYVRVSGIVRSQDVTASNTVLSKQIADAHISYGGNGMVADSNKLGWLARFFVSAIMPF